MIARFLNGPHAGQDIAVTSVQFVLEAVVPSPLLVEPIEAEIGPMPEIVQYRYVGSSGDVLYYTLNHPYRPWASEAIRRGRLSARRPEEQRIPHNEISAIYAQAQQIDPWPGESYEGTSVTLDSLRAAMEEVEVVTPLPVQPMPAWLRERHEQVRHHLEGWLWGGGASDPAATSSDAMTVRFSKMSKEAEAEMEAWDEMLGR